MAYCLRNTIQKAITLGGGVLFFCSFLLNSMAPVHAISGQEFDKAVVKAANARLGAGLALAGYVPIVKGIQSTKSWEWVIAINDAYYTGNMDGWEAVPYPAKLKQDGSSFEYIIAGPEINPVVSRLVLSNKDVAKAIDKWQSKYQDLSIFVKVVENQIVLLAQFEFANASKGATHERLQHLFKASNALLGYSRKAVDDVWKDRWNELKDVTITELDNNDMMILAESSFYEVQEQSEHAKVGYFSYTEEDKYNLEIFNNGDELIFAHWFQVGTDYLQKVMPEIEVYVGKKPIKHAARTVVLEDPEIEGILSVRGIFPLSEGTVTGEQIRDGYKHFKDDFSKGLYKVVWDVVGGKADETWEALSAQKPTYIKKDEIETLLDEDFDGVEGESEEGKEGFWEFTLDDERNVEVTNEGESLLLGMWWELPEEVTADQSEKVIDRVNEYLAKKNVKHFPATAGLYPEYENLVLVSVRIRLDGTVTNEQLREAYTDMMYEFGKDLHKQVAKAIKKET